jgi:hypothetical protein
LGENYYHAEAQRAQRFWMGKILKMRLGWIERRGEERRGEERCGQG